MAEIATICAAGLRRRRARLGLPHTLGPRRIRSLLRRRNDVTASTLRASGITIEPVDRVVSCQGEALDLTAREYAILEILVRNAGRFVSRARLEEGIYSWGEEVGSNTVEVYISRLRKRFGSETIETMRGVGYRIPT